MTPCFSNITVLIPSLGKQPGRETYRSVQSALPGARCCTLITGWRGENFLAPSDAGSVFIDLQPSNPSSARNRLVELNIAAPLICFLDADDTLCTDLCNTVPQYVPALLSGELKMLCTTQTEIVGKRTVSATDITSTCGGLLNPPRLWLSKPETALQIPWPVSPWMLCQTCGNPVRTCSGHVSQCTGGEDVGRWITVRHQFPRDLVAVVCGGYQYRRDWSDSIGREHWWDRRSGRARLNSALEQLQREPLQPGWNSGPDDLRSLQD